MRIEWTNDQVALLKARLDAHDDAQVTGPDEYVVDLYDFEPPLSMELALGGGVEVLAAEQLAFDEALDGWYLCAPVRDLALLERALRSLL